MTSPKESSPPLDQTNTEAASRSPLCGIMGCFPGNMSACGPPPATDAAMIGYPLLDADASDGAMTDDTPDANATGASDALPAATDASEEYGSADAGGKADSADDVTSSDVTSSDVADEPPVAASCYIKPQGSGIITECSPVGSVPTGGACDDSSDCIALDACVVADHRAPACRPFSCFIPITCAEGTFYDQASLRVAGVNRDDIKIPVCRPSERCTPLTTPSPCTQPGEVCAVVGSNGETSCIVPGTGKQGDACDETNRCGEGLLCSKFNNVCVKLCRVGADQSECIGGTCQGGNRSVPDGFGICVGETADASR